MTLITRQLRKAYHRKGLTYVKIAELSGTSPAAVQRALNGCKVNTYTLVAICEALDISTLHVSETSIEPDQSARQ